MRCLLALSVLMTSGLTMARSADQPPGDSKENLPELVKLKPMEVKPGDDPLRKLRIARYNEALAEVQFHHGTLNQMGAGVPVISIDTTRLVESRLPLCENAAERVALMTQAIAYLRFVEERVVARQQAGLLPMSATHLARYRRIDAEIRLLQEKQSETKAK